mgnify:CR=1 FL=1
MPIKILVVFGTRPEAIKLAPLCHALKNDEEFELTICVTGQHREMLDQVLNLFKIKPDIDLNIMKKNQDLADITSEIIIKIRDILKKNDMDFIVVQGDTTTTLSASIAAFYEKVKIAHVEAGLRTNNILAPFPEEFNRQVVSKISHLHFPPTIESKKHLLDEKIDEQLIHITGNTVIDSLHWVLEELNNNPGKKHSLIMELNEKLKFELKDKSYILVTGHRRENFGQGFKDICIAISKLAEKFKYFHFVYPVHLNPNVQDPVNKLLSKYKNIHLIPPLDYEPFLCLLDQCYFVLTDSGGIQEEAPSLGKPVLVMRDETERPEAIKAGTVKLVGTSIVKIISEASQLIEDKKYYEVMSKSHNPYGDGRACNKIVEIIKNNHHENR